MASPKTTRKVSSIAVTVLRDGKFRQVQPNTPFDFTEGEIKDVTKYNATAMRDPVDESASRKTDEQVSVDQAQVEAGAENTDAARKAATAVKAGQGTKANTASVKAGQGTHEGDAL